MKPGRNTGTFCAHFETLENRRLLSAALANIIFSPNLSSSLSTGLDAFSKPAVTNPTPTGYSPAQISAAYGFNNITFKNGRTIGNGAGQTIAIVDAYDDPNIASDLATFDAKYNLPALDGKKTDGLFSEVKMSTTLASDPTWNLEESLDVEWAHAIAPKANILLIESASSSGTDLLAGLTQAQSTPGVSVISLSWGAPEFAGESAFDSYFTTPAGHTPITYVAAAGDVGAGAQWPSVSPNVLSVGGSSLSLNSSGSILSDTAWNYGSGGISAYELKPSYQSSITLSATNRTVPDVSYNADPNHGFSVYDSETYSNETGWFEVGGTSAGAPQWAALIAIADQGRAVSNLKTLNGATQTLPMLYAAASRDFIDITTTTTPGPANAATSGYDLVTGLGDPKARSIIEQVLV